MTIRLLQLIILALTLSLSLSCAKRETKTIGARKTKKADNEESLDANGGDDGTSGGNEEDNGSGIGNETLPNSMNQEEFDQGRTYIGLWDGRSDEPDPSNKWQVRSTRNPTRLGGGDPDSGINGGGPVDVPDNVMAVLGAHCASCHSTNGTRSTSNFNDINIVRRYYTQIKSKVRSGNMPPQQSAMSTRFGSIEKNIIANWVRSRPGTNNYANSQQYNRPNNNGQQYNRPNNNGQQYNRPNNNGQQYNRPNNSSQSGNNNNAGPGASNGGGSGTSNPGGSGSGGF